LAEEPADYSIIGKRLPKLDGPLKASGAAIYTVDKVLPRMLYGKILRSPLPHARILHLDTSRALKLSGVKAVVTGADIAKIKYGLFKKTRDEYGLAIDKVRFIGEEVAAVAAADEDIAEAALGLIEVEYEGLPEIFDPIQAMRQGAAQIHDHAPSNIGLQVDINFGDVEAEFARSDCVRSDTFTTSACAHGQMEPHGALADYNPAANELEIWVPNQGPFVKRKLLSSTLQLPVDNVKVRKSYVGGAFGSQSDMLRTEYIASLLSMKAKRPVKITLSREEVFSTTRQKHPFIVTVKTGVKRDGALLAREYKVVADGGAYSSTGAIAITYPALVTLGLWRLANFRYQGLRVYTNNCPRGAMKGHGNQQVRFADESQLDLIAQELNLDPVEIRLKNAVQAGDTLINKTKVYSCGLTEAIQRTATSRELSREQGKPHLLRGYGLACGAYTSGFYYGFRTAAAAFVKLNEDGQATVITGLVDNGQGNDTMAAMAVAEELGLPLKDVTVVCADTEVCPLDPGSHSMTTTFVSGRACQLAAQDARAKLLEVVAEELECRPEDLMMRERMVYVKGSPDRGLPIRNAVGMALAKRQQILGSAHYAPYVDPVDWVEGKIEGQMTGAYTYGCALAEVEVNPDSGQVKVTKLVGVSDCGKAINPSAVEGQIEGGLGFALGQVLGEELIIDKGLLVNPSFLDYKICSLADMPRIETIIVESHDPQGPFGAKQAADATHIAAVPAIANAVANAIGDRIDSLPITPEKVLAVLDRQPRARG
jgi:4-hydroxybenzoyl-CoA reductase alpha subunit